MANKEYSVEKVVARRIRAGKVTNLRNTDQQPILMDYIFAHAQIEYCVKWKGFPTAQNTWEPESHLTGCAHLLENFKKQSGRQPQLRSAEQHVSEDSSSGDGDDGKQFVVEAVVNRRIRLGQVSVASAII